MHSLSEVEAEADCGLEGDRYSNAAIRRSPDYQLTQIELEAIEAFRLEMGLPLAIDGPRRNLVTQGVRLNDLNGRTFWVGAVELRALELCEPCSTFVERTHGEVLRYFVGRGGLRCRILTGGVIRVGDRVADHTGAEQLSAPDVPASAASPFRQARG